MSIAKQLQELLARCVVTGPELPGPSRLADPKCVVELDLVDADGIAAALNFVRAEPQVPARLSAPELRSRAERLAGKLTYLLEPLRLVELDAGGDVAQVRSHPPRKTDDAKSYYELIANAAGGLDLRRYAKTAGTQPRQQATMHLTREALALLVSDLAEAASEANPG